MNRFLLVTMLFVVAGCATPSPEPSQSESFQATESSSNELLEHNNPAENIGGTQTVAKNFEGIEDVEAPGVSETAQAVMPPPRLVESDVVCEWTIPTGSTLRVKVCRRQSDIDRNRITDQRLIDDIKRNAALGTSRL